MPKLPKNVRIVRYVRNVRDIRNVRRAGHRGYFWKMQTFLRRTGTRLHGISARIFAGGIISTALLHGNILIEESTFFTKLMQVAMVFVLLLLTGNII